MNSLPTTAAPADRPAGLRITILDRLATLDRTLILVLVIAVVMNGMSLSWGLPLGTFHEGLPLSGQHGWEVDGIAPLGPLMAAKRMFVDDWWNSGYWNKYPLGHFFVIMAAYAPYVAYLKITGGLQRPSEVYPFGLTDPETALTDLVLIARGVSALMGVGIVLLVYLTVRRMAGRGAALLSALTIAVSPAFIFYAQTSNVDTPSLFWSALGLFAFGRIVAGHVRLRDYVVLGAAVGMAGAVKEQTLGLFMLMPLSVVILHTQHSHPAPRSVSTVVRTLLDRKLLAGFAVSLAVFVMATHAIFNWDGTVMRFRWRLFHIHPIYGTEYPGAEREFSGPLEGAWQIAANSWDAMNPLLFLAALAGLAILPIRHRWARHFALALGSYLLLVVVVAPINFVRARFVMEVILVLALFAGPLLHALWRRAVGYSRLLALPFLLLGAYSFAYGFDVNYLRAYDARYEVEQWFAARVGPGATVEVYSGPVYLPRFPRHVTVRQAPLTSRGLEGLSVRLPDFIVLTSGTARRYREGTEGGSLLGPLLGGDFGYLPVRTFGRDPLISPRLFAGLSPEIVVLARRR